MRQQAAALWAAYAYHNRTQAAWGTLRWFEQCVSSSNQLTKQAAVDGSSMKWVLQSKYHAAQFLRVEYLCFWGGDFAPPCVGAST